MPKYRPIEHDDEYRKRPVRRRKGWFRKRNVCLAFLFLLIGGIGIGTPMALSHREFVVANANRFAGIAPFRIDLDAIRIGWFRPLRIEGLRLIDQAGVELVRVGELGCERGLWAFVTNYRQLGTVTIRGAQMQVDVQPGTTSVEEALKPLLAEVGSSEPTPTPASSSNLFPQGRIRIENAVIVARDSVDLATWQLTISEADVPLPTAEQRLPPINLEGVIQQVVAAKPGTPLAEGRFTIRTRPLEGGAEVSSSIPPMQMTIATNGLPLEWYSLVHRRFPTIPIESLKGQATVQADVEMLTPVDILAKIATAQIDQISMTAPQILGKEGAALRQVRLSGTVRMDHDRVRAENAILESDVGAIGVSASLPFELVPPSATQPWIPNAQWEMKGNIDLAKLLKVAPGMVPLQANTQLTRGKATLSSSQSVSDTGQPRGEHRIQLGDLVANVKGTSMSWENALTATAKIDTNAQGQPRIAAECLAEFCELEAEGELQAGSFHSKVDLDKLHQRLSQWFALPVSQLSGNANVELTWKQESGNRVAAKGNLETTPLRIGLANGRLNEPAWKGSFEAIGTLDRGSLLQIDRGSLVLDSDGENLRAELQEPLSWTTPAPGAAPLPPAAMMLTLTGDMTAWQRRAQLIAGFDAGMNIEGRCDLKAQGAIDTRHVEITTANFSAQPLVIQGDGMRIKESRVEGTFAGRFDSSDVARLQVEKLLLQAESFALTAKDSAAVDGRSREGRAAFRIEPKRLMSAVAMNENGTAAPATLSIEGDITGTAKWTIQPTTDIRWQLVVDGKDLRVLQPTPPPTNSAGQLVSARVEPPTMSTLWEEAVAKATLNGVYDLSSGKLELPETTLQTVWMAYGGSTSVESTSEKTRVIARGQMTYDAAAVAEKLKPWTGSYLAVHGQRTEPVEVTWTSGRNISWSEGLQAKTQIGWDGANLVGIEIGQADVPFSIENGQLRSKTTIPVSQGALRWDLDGDIGGDPIVIRQAPEMVLEKVAITPQMCQGWLKYVAPLVADVTSVQGQLSLQVDRAEIVPSDPLRQTIVGQLMVQGATVGPGPLADQLLGIVQQVRALRKGGAAGGTSTQDAWLQMPEQNVYFAVEQGRVTHRNLQIRAGDVVIQTDGGVGIDGQLELTARIPILKDWVDGTPTLAPLAGQEIQIPVRGTIQQPQVDFQAFTAIGRQMAEAAAQGALQKQIDRGLNKILGPLESKLGPLQQNLQQSLPQLPALPGGFQIPGFGGGAPPAVPPPPGP